MTESNSHDWIEPTQARSRKKVQRILDAARDLLIEQGTFDLKMTEVAKAAKVAVGTLYQFFPTRSALTQKLFAGEMSVIDAGVAKTFYQLRDPDELSAQIEVQLLSHLRIVQSRPAMMVIWGSAAIDPVIQAADLLNTQTNAVVLTDRILSEIGPEADLEAVSASSILVCHLWSSVIRLCVQAEHAEADAIIREYSKMIAQHMQSLI